MGGTVSSVISDFEKHYKSTDMIWQGITEDDPQRLPTGIFQLDLALGGGIPLGRTIIVYGPEDSMKSSLAYMIIGQHQKHFPEKVCVFIDTEGHFNAGWAQKMGVDTEKLVYVIPHNAEQVVNLAEGFMDADDIGILCLDSLAAMITTAESDSMAEKAMVGNTGIIINKFYRKMANALGRAKMAGRQPTFLAINQIRMKIGVMYGNPETMPGGPAFKHGSALTLRVYGKDEIDPEISKVMPAYKKVSVVVKKFKMPIIAKNCEFMVALRPVPKYGLQVGQAYEWNTISKFFKDFGWLVKGKKEWELTLPDTGETLTCPKLDVIRDMIRDDPTYGARVKALIYKEVLSNDGHLDPPTTDTDE